MQVLSFTKAALKTGCLLVLLAGTLAHSQEEGPPPPPDGPPPQSEGMTPAKRPDVDHVISQMSKRYKLTAEQQTLLKPVLIDEWNKISALQQDTALALTERKKRIKLTHQETSARIAEILTKEQFEKFEQDQAKMEARTQQGEDQDGPPPPPPDGAGGPPPPM